MIHQMKVDSEAGGGRGGGGGDWRGSPILCCKPCPTHRLSDPPLYIEGSGMRGIFSWSCKYSNREMPYRTGPI